MHNGTTSLNRVATAFRSGELVRGSWRCSRVGDPPGEPSGRIRWAVLVVGGQRYRGATHIQAAQHWLLAHPEAKLEQPVLEGFETESGHFLDRAQAAVYLKARGLDLAPEHSHFYTQQGQLYVRRTPVLRGQQTPRVPDLETFSVTILDEEGNVAVARDGGRWRALRVVLDKAAPEEQLRAVISRGGIAVLTVERRGERIVVRLQGDQPNLTPVMQELGVTRWRWVSGPVHDELTAVWAPLHDEVFERAASSVRHGAMGALHILGVGALAGRSADQTLDEALAVVLAGVAAGFAAVAPIAARIGRAGADHDDHVTEHERRTAAEERRAALRAWLEGVQSELWDEVRRGRAEGLTADEIAARVHDFTAKLAQTRLDVVVATEAQSIYGRAVFRGLRRAGYTHAFWVTMNDDRVRPSHRRCEAAGAVPLGKPFPNGLYYPGDPNGPPEEVINCRCWLVPARRAVTGQKYFATAKETMSTRLIRAAEQRLVKVRRFLRHLRSGRVVPVSEFERLQKVSDVLARHDPRPAIFTSRSPEGGKMVTKTAVNLVKITPVKDEQVMAKIAEVWFEKPREELDALSWDTLAHKTGLPVEKLASTLRFYQRVDPASVQFVIDRMGASVGVQLRAKPTEQIRVSVSRAEADEILRKLLILADEPELLEEYNLDRETVLESADLLPKDGGIWSIDKELGPAFAEEIRDAANILYDMADDARSELHHKEARQYEKLAARLQTIADSLEGRSETELAD